METPGAGAIAEGPNTCRCEFVEKSNPSIADYPSLVDNSALTKKSTIGGFSCTTKNTDVLSNDRAATPDGFFRPYALFPCVAAWTVFDIYGRHLLHTTQPFICSPFSYGLFYIRPSYVLTEKSYLVKLRYASLYCNL